MFYPHGMAFLDDALSQSSFLARMKALYREDSIEYQQIKLADTLTQELFADEHRLNGELYITHPRSVALIASELVGVRNYRVIIGCLIHDNREHAEEQRINQWGTRFVLQNFDAFIEWLIASQTMPCIRGKVTKEIAHEMYHNRVWQYRKSHVFFEMKLPDRLHNLWTLSPKIMPVEKVHEKNAETEKYYAPFSRRHGILTQEFHDTLEWMKKNN